MRRVMDEDRLEELKDSIIAKGVLQPLLVRKNTVEDSKKTYELIAGERRLRASKAAMMESVPVLVVTLDDQQTLEAAFIENAQRENLNAIEEAYTYKRLVEEFKLTQKKIAEAVGKSRVTITNSLRLLQLEHRVLSFLEDGHLSAGHGRILLMLENHSLQYSFAKKAIEEEMSVHALGRLVSKKLKQLKDNTVETLDEEEERLLAKLERARTKVADSLGLEEVSLKMDGEGRRRLNLVFDTEAAWKRFMTRVRD
ncbi:UNVERIFIED_CONTAM: hypothetical protein GTU68_018231 [Idotea baltica]|nr:hypothetical protein [Idotea baltica]